jgi:hypothetical protein
MYYTVQRLDSDNCKPEISLPEDSRSWSKHVWVSLSYVKQSVYRKGVLSE